MLKNLYISAVDSGINKNAIQKLIGALRDELKFEIISLEIIFIDSKKIKKLNKQYLNHNYSTDILTFDYSDISSKLESEIIISIDDAKKNADKFKVKFEEEICRLIIHGILHLLGYNDDTTKNKSKMKLLENKLLNRFKFVLLRKR